MSTISLPTLEDTLHLGYLLGKHLPAGATVLLKGNLGAGKTSLVQGIGRGLDIFEPIVSPTFTLINEYIDGRLPLYHLDLYRLEPAQTDSLNPEMYWLAQEVTPGITAIEWSERLLFKPLNYLEVELTTSSTQGRKAELRFQGQDVYNLDLLEIQPKTN